MNRLGVAGCGVMGSGIAKLGARGGCDVIVVDVFPDALAAAQERIHASLTKAHAAGKLAEPVAAIVGRLSFTSDVAALADREIVIEAIREAVEDKVALIAQLDTVLSPEAIVATNTSSIPVAQIAAASSHPGRVLGTHFYEPGARHAPRRGGPLPAHRSRGRGSDACLLRGRAGQEGDPGCRSLGLRGERDPRALPAVGHPLAPERRGQPRGHRRGDGRRVRDAHGPHAPVRHDRPRHHAARLGEPVRQHLDAAFAPPALLKRHVEAGLLGRKSGRGFYDYAGSPSARSAHQAQRAHVAGSAGNWWASADWISRCRSRKAPSSSRLRRTPPAGHLVIALAGVAGAARRGDVVERVAAAP